MAFNSFNLFNFVKTKIFMKKYIYFFLFTLLSPLILKAQSVVISEYMNQSDTPEGEWTELIVVEDSVDMRGWKLRDNSDNESWRPGVTFKNIDLWLNVRKGTIIVINHRYSGLNLDLDPSDGYIEVTAADPNVFDIPADFESGGSGSLSINQKNDMIQLLDASGNNVYTLGHSQQSGSPWTDFQAINVGSKLMHNGQLANGASLRVFPGSDLSDYNAGFDQNRLYTVANNSSSKGQPNKRVASDPQSNYEFWQRLREPDWKTTNVPNNVEYFGNDVKISWGQLPSRKFSSYEGFMIVRIPLLEIGNYIEPVDSKIYQVGENIEGGSGKVVGDISFLIYLANEMSFIDKDFVVNAECNKSYIYKIYYYMFNKDHQIKDGYPESGRGRAYSYFSLTTSTIFKPLPEKPRITTKDNRTEYCEDEDFELTSSVTQSTENSLQWILDGNPIPGATTKTYKPTKSGQYVVKVTNNLSKCENISEILQISILPKPVAKLYQLTKQGKIPITKDTTYYVCKDDDPDFDFPVLEMEGGSRLEWYFNDKLKNEEINKNQTIAVQKGQYFGLVKNGECVDKTPNVYLEHIQYFFDIKPNPLFLDADDNPSGEVTITNYSNVDVVITDPLKFKVVNPAFSLVDVTFPLIIKKNQSIKIKINYQRTQNGKDETYILMVLDCFQAYRINLSGVKKAPGVAEVVAYPNETDFGVVPDCEINKLNKKITVKSIGTVPVKILNTKHSTNLSVVDSLPKILSENESLEFEVQVTNSTEGKYDEVIEIPYETIEKNPKQDTLKVNVKYIIVHPKLNYNSIATISIPTCSDSVLHEFEIENPTELPITITNNFQSSKVQIDYPPLPIYLKAKEKTKLRLIAVSNANDIINEKFNISPCNIDTAIIFQLEKRNISINIEQSQHDFGVIPFCANGMYPVKFNTKLNIKGGSVQLKEIKNLNNFKVNLNIDQIISDVFTVEFEYQGKNPGVFNDKIELVFDPCDLIIEIVLSGMSVKPEIEVDPILINFGNVGYSQEYSQSIKVNNKSPFPLDFTFQTNKPEFSSSEYKLKINSDQSGVIQISFKSDVPNTTFLDTLYIYTEPCAEIILKIPLRAKTLSNFSSGIISLDLPEIVSGYVGDIVSVQLTHKTTNLDLSTSGITELNYYFKYNGNQVYPNNLIPKNPNWKNIIETFVLTEESINNAKLKVKFKSKVEKNLDLDFDLELLMLQTNQLNNILKIDSIQVVAGGEISFELDSTKIQTLDNCRLNQRNIIIDNSEYIPRVEYKNDKINIEFHTPINGDVAINLYSSNGELLQNNNFNEVKYGTYQTQLDVSKYQSGVYFIEVRTPMGRFTKKIIIVR